MIYSACAMNEPRVDAKARPRPGGRSARIRSTVLSVTMDMLLNGDAAELTIREIAARAQVAETTLYRRWGTPMALLMEALSEFATIENPTPDTGSLDGDLRQLLHNVVALLERPEVRRMFRRILALSPVPGEAEDARHRFWLARFAAGAIIVERAIARGELVHGVAPDDLLEVLVGTAYVRAFLTERPLDQAMIERAVGSALALARAQG